MFQAVTVVVDLVAVADELVYYATIKKHLVCNALSTKLVVANFIIL